MRQKTEIPEPVRSCIGCRSRRPQSALVRITRSSSGITVDGPSCGRGAWLCRDDTTNTVVSQCVDTAISKRAFARAWRSDVSAEDNTNIVESIRHHVEEIRQQNEQTGRL